MQTLRHPILSHFVLHVLGFKFNTMNLSYHHIVCASMPCIECYFFPVCFYFSPVGSGVDVSNESDVKINHTEDQYLSINEQVKKENPGYLL
jgi:hypothetical protein